MSLLFDPIRGEHVKATPEEIVRQKLIVTLVNELGFSKDLILVEKALAQLPHLSLEEKAVAPKRRCDLICFAKHPSHSLYPLLLVECKAGATSPRMLRQLIGYNFYVKARFIALISDSTTHFGYYSQEHQSYQFQNTLPDYHTLLRMP